MGAHISVPMYRRSLPQRLRLEGRRCSDCSHVQFPPTAHCPNCHASRLEPINLSGQGEVHAVTQITPEGAPPEFTAQARAEGGYYVAIVKLAEGPKITAQLVGFKALPALGTPVKAETRRLYTEEGVIRYGFKFGPQEESAS